MSDYQSLLLADDLFPDIDNRSKRATIRFGRRDTELGPLQFIGATNGEIKRTVDVHRVSYTLAGNLTARDAFVEGERNVIVLYESMKRFYPDLTPDSTVTIIEFDLPDAD